MSHNLQEVFKKFGFKSRDKTSTTRRIQQQSDDQKNIEDINNNNNNLTPQQLEEQKLAYLHKQQELIRKQRKRDHIKRAKREKAEQEKQKAYQYKMKHQPPSQPNTHHTHTQSQPSSHHPHPSHHSNSQSNHQHYNTHSTSHQLQNENNTNTKPKPHHSSSTHKTAKSSQKRSAKPFAPTGQYAHLDPKLFDTNSNNQTIAKIMKLTHAPSYKTDEKGYIEFQPGLFIRNQFVCLDTLGRGTFSKVFEAVDIMDQSRIAIKVIRNTHRYIEAAKTELRVLQHLTNADDGTSSCIHLRDHFSWNGHPCFVFKLFGPSIYTIMNKNRFRPFPDNISRSLIYQICNAIQFLHHLGIIFTDLKPENMVFVDGRTYPIKISNKTHLLPLDTRIKIVDFGSAVYEPRYDSNNPKTWKFKDGYNYLIQTRHYRAPEVVLEMPWKRPVDVWSVGCVILEFIYGSMVFNTHCPIDHLNQMQKMIGKVPRDLIRLSSDSKYKQLFHHPDGSLRLEDARKSRAQAKRLDNYFNLNTLEHRHLYDLTSRCLKWRANERILGHQLLKHEYFYFIKNILSHKHKYTISNSYKSHPHPSSSNSKNNGHHTHSNQ